MIRHIVSWRFAEKDKEKNIAEARSRLLSLPAHIAEIIRMETGINIQDSAFAHDMVLICDFASEDALAAYQQHPRHQEVSQFIRSVIEARTVVDYVVE